MYQAQTQGVRVTAAPKFLEAESSPSQGRYFWAYSIEIVNLSTQTVQLVTRHWFITDGNGETHEVRGEGVVGKQPVLRPGESFSYTSGCPLTTPSGIMVGSYQMQTESGEMFVVDIPAFSLDMPNQARIFH